MAGVHRALLFVIATGLAPAVAGAPPVPLRAVVPSQTVPVLELPDMAGRRTSIATPEKITIVHFWASWCEPCREEFPDLAALAEQRSGQPITIVAVAADRPEAVRDYLARHGIKLPVLLDQYGDALFAYRVPALPASIVVDARGRLRFRAVGRVEWLGATATRALDGLLAETAGP